MALIKCSECQQEVSENATSYPHCGNPLNVNTVNVQTAPNQRVEIELTSKRWKKVILISAFFIVLGLIVTAKSSGDGWVFGVLSIIIGIIIGIIGKFGAWYSNR